VAVTYGLALLNGLGAGEARMFAFVSLVIGNLGLIFADRSRTRFIYQSWRTRNGAIWWVSGGALFFLGLVLATPGLREVFQFAPLHRWEVALLSLAGLGSIFFAEIVKLKVVRRTMRLTDS